MRVMNYATRNRALRCFALAVFGVTATTVCATADRCIAVLPPKGERFTGEGLETITNLIGVNLV